MAADPQKPRISWLTLRFFRGVARRYFRKHFRSVMVQHLHLLRDVRGPLIVYGNHASWWDPLLMILMARTALPARRHYAPMDAASLQRYPIFRRLGVFPVEMASPRGAARFLRTGMAVLRSGGVLWLTPQGRFADPRQAALDFKTGIGALAVRMPEVPLLPMAVEYTFWDERLPETLVRLGKPVYAEAGATAEDVTRQLEKVLAAEMQALQQASVKRDADEFELVLRGGRGTGGWYAWARRVRAWVTGKRVQQDHTPRTR